jgi:Flp pilus assembly protein TadD
LPESAKAYEEFLRRFGDRYGDAALRATVREAKLTLSSLCTQTGRADEAEEWLEQVLDEFPDETGVKNDLGYLWADRGVHLQRALRMVQQAIDDDPDNHAFRDSLGWVLYRMGRYPEAVEQLRKAVREESPDGEILDHLAEAQLRAEGEIAARATWQRALEVLKPGDGPLRRRIEEKLADLVRE